MRPEDSPPASAESAGTLTVVGTGIQLIRQMTLEARDELERADEVLFVANEPAAAAWIRRLNPRARSLADLYRPGRVRTAIYAEMVEEIIAAVRRGGRVCAAFYGHPGVFVRPSHEAIRRARLAGFAARMLPGISAEDCLFADLGVDPAEQGCQSYDATEFLVRRHTVDPTAGLILWQIDVVGVREYEPEPSGSRLPVLVDALLRWYPPDHEVALYAASPYAISDPVMDWKQLARLAEGEPVIVPTLYVPPLAPRPLDPAMLDRLGMAAPAPATTP